MRRRYYTDDQKAMIVDPNRKSIAQLALIMDRSEHAIRLAIYRFRKYKPGNRTLRPFTTDEDQAIMDPTRTISLKQLAVTLNRTPNDLLQRSYRLGTTSGKIQKFTPAEDQEILKLVETLPCKEIAHRLHRNVNVVGARIKYLSRANRFSPKYTSKRFTQNEDAKLLQARGQITPLLMSEMNRNRMSLYRRYKLLMKQNSLREAA